MQVECNGKKKTKKSKKVLTIVVSAFLVMAFCLCVYVIVQVLSKGYVSFGGYSFFRVVTGSMGETLPIDTLTITKSKEITDIKENDIVTFESESPNMLGMLITHRVVDIITLQDGKVVLQTKGDANLSIDGQYVDQDHLVGKVVWSTAEDGFIASFVGFLTDKIGFIICIVFPSVLIAGFMLSEMARKMKEDIEEAVNLMDKQNEVQQESEEEMRNRILAELKEELKVSGGLEDKKQ